MDFPSLSHSLQYWYIEAYEGLFGCTRGSSSSFQIILQFAFVIAGAQLKMVKTQQPISIPLSLDTTAKTKKKKRTKQEILILKSLFAIPDNTNI